MYACMFHDALATSEQEYYPGFPVKQAEVFILKLNNTKEKLLL